VHGVVILADVRLGRYLGPFVSGPPSPHVRTTRITLGTDDGVRLDAVHLDGSASHDTVIILVHGLAGCWRLPAFRRIAAQLSHFGGVIAADLRGHGRSTGVSTLGDREVTDLATLVAYARFAGYRKVVAVGFSMGGSVALRYAALDTGLRAVVSVSSPKEWHYRGTRAARRVQWCINRPFGRLTVRLLLGTRLSGQRWDHSPLAPGEAAARISIPLLIIHGDADPFVPAGHARGLFEAAHGPKELWIEKGMGHAEANISPHLVSRIGQWITLACSQSAGA
jgi:pimeloyl-ACP methyl ester carboxylesterase